MEAVSLRLEASSVIVLMWEVEVAMDWGGYLMISRLV